MDSSAEDAAGAPRPINRVQLVVGCAVVTVTAVILCFRYDWWPLQSNISNVDRLLVGVYGTLLLLVLLSIWLVSVLRSRYAKKRGLRWPGYLTPAALAAGLVFFFVPGPTDFSDARPSMQTVATQMLHEPSPQRRVDERIGGLDFSRVVAERSWVRFVSADSFLTYESGWIYAPSEVPSGFGWASLRDLGGHWYSYERND